MSEKKERILDTAAKLFARYGPRKTTIDEIAAEAGIAKGTVYLSFSSKEDIFIAVGRRETDLILSELRRVVRNESTACAKLERFLNTRFAAEDGIREKFQLTQEAAKESRTYPQSEKVREEFYAGELHIIRDILEFGIESGEFKKVRNPDRTCRVLSNLMQGLEMRCGASEENQLKVQDKVSMFLELVVDGLAPRKK